jgi:hypothetical protein
LPGGRADPLQEQKAAHVIDNIGQSDPHGGTGDAHCPDEQSRLSFLISKDMLDTGSDNGFPGIGPLDVTGHGLEIWLFPVNLQNESLLFHEGFIDL